MLALTAGIGGVEGPLGCVVVTMDDFRWEGCGRGSLAGNLGARIFGGSKLKDGDSFQQIGDIFLDQFGNHFFSSSTAF